MRKIYGNGFCRARLHHVRRTQGTRCELQRLRDHAHDEAQDDERHQKFDDAEALIRRAARHFDERHYGTCPSLSVRSDTVLDWPG